MKKVRTIFRNDTYTINKNLLKILFTIGSFKDDILISQKLLSAMLKISPTTLNYRITKLKDKGLITTKNHLTSKGIKAIQYFKHWDKSLSKKLRAHKIQISIKLLKLPDEFFNLKHKILTPFTNQKYKGLKGQILGSQVLFYSSKKLIIKIPDIFGNSNDEIMGGINDCVAQLFQALTLEFKGIVFDSYEICKFDSMHIAILNSIIAESFLLKEKRNFHGENGFCIDGSHGIPELEVEELSNITENIEILVKYEDLVRENKKLTKMLAKYTKK